MNDSYCSVVSPVRFLEKMTIEDDQCTVWILGQSFSIVLAEPVSLKLMCAVPVFTTEYVRGVRIAGSILCVYAGMLVRFALVEKTGDHKIALRFSEVMYASDWILDVIVFPGSSGYAHLLTAQGNLISYSLLSSGGFAVQRISDTQQKIFYSGRIMGDCWSSLCLINGSVDGHIVVRVPSNDETLICIHNQRHHDGAIMDIDLCIYRQRLCSVADDRSCSVWQVNNLPSSFDQSHYPAVEHWRRSYFTPLFKVYGHLARVWRCGFSTFGLVTSGEDGVVNLWSDSGGLCWSRRLTGGSIRAMCIDEDTKTLLLGSDSGAVVRLSLWPVVSSCSTECSRSAERVNVVHVLSITPACLLYATSEGRVCIHNGDGSGEQLLICTDDLRSPMSCRSRSSVLLAGRSGVFFLFHESQVKQIYNASGELMSLHSLGATDDRVLVCLKSGIMKIMQCRSETATLISMVDFPVWPLPAIRSICAATIFLLSNSGGDREVLVVGHRCGSVSFYDVRSRRLMNRVMGLHGKHGVTHVCVIRDSLYTTGRDGRLCQWKEENDNLKVFTNYALSKEIPWPWRLMKNDENNGMLIGGFAADRCMVIDWPTDMNVVQIQCGGGHRAADLCLQAWSKGSSAAAYVRGCKVVMVTWRYIADVLIVGGHRRRINDACMLVSASDDHRIFVVAASEDTFLSTWKVDKMVLKLCQRYPAHISSVFSVCVVDELVVSAGGRGQIIVWNLCDQQLRLLTKFHDTDQRYTRVACKRFCKEVRVWLVAASRADGVITIRKLFWCSTVDTVTVINMAQLRCCSCAVSLHLCKAGTNGIVLLTLWRDGSLMEADIDESYEHVSEWRQIVQLDAVRPTAMTCAWINDVNIVVVGDTSGAVYLLNSLRTNVEKIRLPSVHASSVTGLAVTKEGFLAAVSADWQLRIWLVKPNVHCFAKSMYNCVLGVADPSGVCAKIKGSRLYVIVSGIGLACLCIKWKRYVCTQCQNSIC